MVKQKILDFKKGELGKNKNKKLQIETKNWNTITHHVFNLLEVSWKVLELKFGPDFWTFSPLRIFSKFREEKNQWVYKYHVSSFWTSLSAFEISFQRKFGPDFWTFSPFRIFSEFRAEKKEFVRRDRRDLHNERTL